MRKLRKIKRKNSKLKFLLSNSIMIEKQQLLPSIRPIFWSTKRLRIRRPS